MVGFSASCKVMLIREGSTSPAGGKADIGQTFGDCPLLTQSGHWPSEFGVMHNRSGGVVGFKRRPEGNA